ncbi:MAG: PAS domain S-box protein [Polaromonas sp.]|nr:PAS domain S-box protein [Polaromonas sp.]
MLEERQQLTVSLERKVRQRTAELTRQEALFRALAQQAPEVVWTADPQGRVTYLNRAFFDLMGGDLARWSGRRWFTALHPDDLADVKTNWATASAAGTQFAGVRRLFARDGRLRTMSYRASPVLDETGTVAFWVGIDTDITNIKAIEAALRVSNEELEAFSYSVSHDLRSPLNTIDGFSRLLARQLQGESGEKAKHFLSRIHAGVAQMGQLIEDLLSLAQVSRTELRHEPIDLSALARLSLDRLRARDPERQVNAVVEPGLRAEGDARLIHVVLDNLLGNAWKFSAHRTPAYITVSQLRDAAGQTVFYVRDNGAGFDMAHADKLFRAFQRLHTHAEFEGTGIGLATVQRIIGRHGGMLWADALVGQGACFSFVLPKVGAAVLHSPQPAQASAPAATAD